MVGVCQLETAIDAVGAAHYGSTFAVSSRAHLLTGLTAGATYNVRLLMRTTYAADTASFANRELSVAAAP